MDYKCTSSFTTSTGKRYSYGDKISSSDYRMLSTIEQRNFESTSSSSSSSSSSDDDSPFGFGKPMSMAMGDMLGTGIPGGLDMDKGSLGHSDADVLLHAICDALLGALSLGDIGFHFPNTDPAYKNIDSKILLEKSFALIRGKGYTVVNVDSTLCLEAPKIKPWVPQMQQTIAAILQLPDDAVSVKATTTETMGFAGREEGLMAYATVLLKKD